MKAAIHKACIDLIKQRIANAEEAIGIARESANEEGKSSAGDKHETGRAMAQLEQENAGRQLAELTDQLQILQRIDAEINSSTVSRGSLVDTSMGKFYLSVGLGKVQINGADIFAISPDSPIGKVLMGAANNASLEFNGRKIQITSLN